MGWFITRYVGETVSHIGLSIVLKAPTKTFFKKAPCDEIPDGEKIFTLDRFPDTPPVENWDKIQVRQTVFPPEGEVAKETRNYTEKRIDRLNDVVAWAEKESNEIRSKLP